MPSQVGTLREKPLHASLKKWYSEPGDRVEATLGRYVIDLVRDELLIEIQTKGFASMKQKVIALLDRGHRLRIVYPIPVDKWIVKVEADGTVLSRRRSPKHGTAFDVFTELVSFPELVGQGLEIDCVSVIEEEYRRHTPDQAWRRKGWVIIERRLVEILGSRLLRDAGDLASLIPRGLPDPFTTADVARTQVTPRRTAQQMTYCLTKTGILTSVGKQGNAVLYRQS